MATSVTDNPADKRYEIAVDGELAGVIMYRVTGTVIAFLHTETLDGVIQVSEEDAYELTVRCAREEGILVGPSSGAALAAVAQKLTDIPDGSTVLTFCYDTGERYFSVEGLFDADGTNVQVRAQP